MVEAHPAATVAILKAADIDFEVLLVKRNEELDFCGGAWVFPGGRVDSKDVQLAKSSALLDAAKIAAVREVFEETAIRIEADQLEFMDHFTTPSSSPKRFSTYFFLTAIRSVPKIQVDGSEILAYRWMTPQNALTEHEQGDLYLPVPTMIILDRLASCSTIESVLRKANRAEPQHDLHSQISNIYS